MLKTSERYELRKCFTTRARLGRGSGGARARLGQGSGWTTSGIPHTRKESNKAQDESRAVSMGGVHERSPWAGSIGVAGGGGWGYLRHVGRFFFFLLKKQQHFVSSGESISGCGAIGTSDLRSSGPNSPLVELMTWTDPR